MVYNALAELDELITYNEERSDVIDGPNNDVLPNDNMRHERELRAIHASVSALVAAGRTILAKYDAAPDGPLGVGLVNGDFDALRVALARFGKPSP